MVAGIHLFIQDTFMETYHLPDPELGCVDTNVNMINTGSVIVACPSGR